MAGQKTLPTDADVEAFLDEVTPDQRRRDGFVLLEMMQRVTGFPAVMWGASLIGFGRYDYKYMSGHEGFSFLTGFSPRKQNLVIYNMPGFDGFGDLMAKLGKHRTGKSCLYINRLDDVDLNILEELVGAGFEEMKRRYG